MKFLADFSSLESINNRNKKICKKLKLSRESWFSILKHPAEYKWALCIRDNEENLLTKKERSALKSHAAMEESKWFLDIFIP